MMKTCKLFLVCAGASILVGLGITQVLAQSPRFKRVQTITSAPALTKAANEAFNLEASELLELALPLLPQADLSYVVPIGAELFTMELSPHSVRSPSYTLYTQADDGSLVEQTPGPIRTMRGRIAEIDGSIVAASIEDDGLRARISLPDGNEYWIEPISRTVRGATRQQHVIYNQREAFHDHDHGCGNDAAVPVNERGGRVFQSTEPIPFPEGGVAAVPAVAELACDADHEYYLARGSSVSSTEARINSIINEVNIQYERDVAITHTITAIVVRSSVNDPYSATSSAGIVNEFAAEWNANHGGIQRDVAHLFVGRNVDGSVIGRAFDIGEVCSVNTAYCFSQSDFSSRADCQADLTAHELGHLWNALHCDCSRGSNVYTMNSSITCSNRFQPIDTIPSMQGYRSTSATGSCLTGGDPAPANDDCANAIAICPGSTAGSSDWADNEGGTGDSCADAVNSPDVWYSYTPGSSGTLNVETCGDIWDTALAVHTACPSGSSNQTACNDDSRSCGGRSRQSSISMSVTGGQTYYIRVTGWNNGFGVTGYADDFTVDLSGPSCGGGGCTLNSECDDGDFCNGTETCNSGSCQSGSDPCPGQGCDETNDVCVTCNLGQVGDPCTNAADCCSNKCKGRPGAMTCK